MIKINNLESIYLEQLNNKDNNALCDLVRKNETHLEYLKWTQNYNPQKALQFIIGKNELFELNGDNRELTFKLTNGTVIIGMVAAFNFNYVSMECEIGYWLDESHCHQGIMRQTLITFIDYLFTQQDMSSIIVKVMPRNIDSNRIIMKLYFTPLQEKIVEGDEIFNVYKLDRMYR